MASLALMPIGLGKAIDAGIAARSASEVTRWGLFVLLLSVAAAIAGVCRHRNATLNALTASMRTAHLVSRHLPTIGADLSRRIDPGDVITIGVADIFAVSSGFLELPMAVGSVVAIGLAAAILVPISAVLALVVLVGAPVVMAMTALLIKPLQRRQSEFRRIQGELSTRATDIASGLRVLRGFGGEARFAAAYHEDSARARGAGLKVAGVEALLAAIQVLGPGLFVAAMTWIAALFAVRGEISVGSLVACYGYAVFLSVPFSMLAGAANLMTSAVVASERVVKVLSLRPGDPADSSREPVPARLDGRLAEGDSKVAFEPGLLHAVVCQDTATAELLACRLTRFDTGGTPTLDGVPLALFELQGLRAHLLLARNSDHIFSGTVREALTPVHQVERDFCLDEAVDAAGLRDVVEAMGSGLDSRLESGGLNLSGGQRQRLRLARALAAEPDILVMVDPTSALDVHTEGMIAGRLPAFRRGRSTIVFTRSPLLLNVADTVTYLEKNEVTARGSHRDLLASCPEYRRVFTQEAA